MNASRPDPAGEQSPGGRRSPVESACAVVCKASLDGRERRIAFALVVLLYLVGGLFWAWFLDFGRISFTHKDWAERMLLSYSVLQESMETLQAPLVVAEPMRFGQYETDHFLANPELPVSPQIILLRWLSLGDFVLVNFLLLYTIGFLGCRLLVCRLNLPFAAFAILVLVFNLNGHILSHLSAGHAAWGGYFLLPYVLLWTVDLVETPGSGFGEAELKIALMLGAIMAQGGIRVFLWVVVFLAALGLCHWRSIRRVALAIILGTLLCAARLIPAATVFWGYRREFFPGFESASTLLRALVGGHPFRHWLGAVSIDVDPPSWWEYDTFIGVAGLGFILIFGLVAPLRSLLRSTDARGTPLLPPALILLLFSLGETYRVFYESPLPILNGERVPSRFLVLAMLVVLVVGLVHFGKAAGTVRHGTLLLVSVTVVLVTLATELLSHSTRWSLAAVQGRYIPPEKLAATLRPAGDGATDVVYLSSLLAGLAISCLTLVEIGLLWRARRRAANGADAS